ncbi:sulfatase [Micromonospora sp. LZ34]
MSTRNPPHPPTTGPDGSGTPPHRIGQSASDPASEIHPPTGSPGLRTRAGDGGRRRRTVAARVTTALAALLVLAALTAPCRPGQLTPGAFLRIPLEGLLVAALLLALPGRPRRVVAALAGALLGLLTVLKLADLGFRSALGRPFDVVLDWALLDDAVGFLTDSFGRAGGTGAVVGALVLVLALLVALTAAALRLAGLAARHHLGARRVVAALVALWVVAAATGMRIAPGVPVADAEATALVADHTRQAQARLRDREAFAAQVGADPFRETPGEQLLTALRGKDVIVAFVESYGRDAVEDPEYARVGEVLDAGTGRLRAAGFQARSGFLTSPTIGGGSWLAHDTLLSGLWIDNEQRHRSLLASDRLTLGGAFRRAGWDTVGVMPAATQPWPEGAFFGYDRYYDAAGLGYRGPKFSYAPMPDQYTLATFQRRERDVADRPPLMAEIPLISSHSPWTRIPQVIDWDAVGDGSVYRDAAITNPKSQPRAGYRKAVEYSVRTLISYLETYGDENLVLIFLGDHQPAPVVTGEDASRDVPVSIVAADPAVLDRVAGWGWQDGLRPGPDAPVWPMDAFRDRFLTAFGPGAPAARAQGR